MFTGMLLLHKDQKNISISKLLDLKCRIELSLKNLLDINGRYE